jgi:hypothetical protein
MAKFTIEKVRSTSLVPLEWAGHVQRQKESILTPREQDIAQHIKRTVCLPPELPYPALQLTQVSHSLTRGRGLPGTASWAATLAASSLTVRRDTLTTPL